jgi:hypothetical protein
VPAGRVPADVPGASDGCETSKRPTQYRACDYGGPGSAVTWTCEEAGSKGECEAGKTPKWTRNIPGIDGLLDAVQTNGGTPVLELYDLHGDIVATAADNETEPKLLSTDEVTEYGVPHGTEPKYSWLGALGVQTEISPDVMTANGASYVPQLASTVQTEGVVPPGAAPSGTGTGAVYETEESVMAIESGDLAAENDVTKQRALETRGTRSASWSRDRSRGSRDGRRSTGTCP